MRMKKCKKRQFNYVKVSKEMCEELNVKIGMTEGNVKANEDEFRLPRFVIFCQFEQSDTDNIDVHI